MSEKKISFLEIKKAYALCKDANFVKTFLENKNKRDLVLPDMRGEPCLSIADYSDRIAGTLLRLEDQGELSKELVDRIKSKIPEYFPNDPYLKDNRTGAYTVISLTVLQWLQEIDRASIAVNYYPSSKNK